MLISKKHDTTGWFVSACQIKIAITFARYLGTHLAEIGEMLTLISIVIEKMTEDSR